MGNPKFTPGCIILAGCGHHLTWKQHGGAQTTMAAPMRFKHYRNFRIINRAAYKPHFLKIYKKILDVGVYAARRINRDQRKKKHEKTKLKTRKWSTQTCRVTGDFLSHTISPELYFVSISNPFQEFAIWWSVVLTICFVNFFGNNLRESKIGLQRTPRNSWTLPCIASPSVEKSCSRLIRLGPEPQSVGQTFKLPVVQWAAALLDPSEV